MLDLVGAMQAGASMRQGDLARRDRAMGSIGEGILGLAQALQQAKTQPAFMALELAREKRRQDLASSEAEKQRAHGVDITRMQLDANKPARIMDLLAQANVLSGGDPAKAAGIVRAALSGKATETVPAPEQSFTSPESAKAWAQFGGLTPEAEAAMRSNPPFRAENQPTREASVFENFARQTNGMPPKDEAAIRSRIVSMRAAAARAQETNPEAAAQMSSQADILESMLGGAAAPRTSILEDRDLSNAMTTAFRDPSIGPRAEGLTRLKGRFQLSSAPTAIKSLYEAMASDIEAGQDPASALAEARATIQEMMQDNQAWGTLSEELASMYGPIPTVEDVPYKVTYGANIPTAVTARVKGEREKHYKTIDNALRFLLSDNALRMVALAAAKRRNG